LPPGRGPRHRPSAFLDITRRKQEVGYRPEYTIERALEECLDWLSNHPE
jgi:UDP-glucose 4-epimerase